MLFFNYSMIMLFALASVVVSLVVLFSSTMVAIFSFSILSLFSTMLYLILNAPDVAITEAAVGSAISTIFFLLSMRAIQNNGVIKSAKNREDRIFTAIKRSSIFKSFNLFIVAILIIFVGVSDAFIEIGKLGDTVRFESAEYYLKNSYAETGVKNIVTSVLASYRGFDTLIENLVIMTAAIGVFFILNLKDEERESGDKKHHL